MAALCVRKACAGRSGLIYRVRESTLAACDGEARHDAKSRRRFRLSAPSRRSPATPTCAVPYRIATIALVTKFSTFLLLAASAFAQKQPITLETLNSAGLGGGRGDAGFAGQ